MIKRLLCVAALLAWMPAANASLEDDGAWAAGVWATTAWGDGVWFENIPSAVVPDVVGLSLAAADTALEGALLDTGNTTLTCSPAAENEVISQSPTAGSNAAEGSLVDLIASSGVECVGAGGKFKLNLDMRL